MNISIRNPFYKKIYHKPPNKKKGKTNYSITIESPINIFKKRGRYNIGNWAEWAMVSITIILAICAAGAWIAASRQVIVTRDNAKRELKAYIYIPQKELYNIYNFARSQPIVDTVKKRDTTFHYILRNYGKTPASQIWARVYVFTDSSYLKILDTLAYEPYLIFSIPQDTEVEFLGRIGKGTILDSTINYFWIGCRFQYIDVFRDTSEAKIIYRYYFAHKCFLTENQWDTVRIYRPQ